MLVQEQCSSKAGPNSVLSRLGAALLLAGKTAEAEAVFREDLKRNPNNARSLFGLAESLKAQGKAADAAKVQQQFEQSWEKADTKLMLAEM